VADEARVADGGAGLAGSRAEVADGGAGRKVQG
jgi:hypothetical protein